MPPQDIFVHRSYKIGITPLGGDSLWGLTKNLMRALHSPAYGVSERAKARYLNIPPSTLRSWISSGYSIVLIEATLNLLLVYHQQKSCNYPLST